MKTATIPSLRVAPELRDAVENVLQNGETLSSFVEQSLKDKIQQRIAQQAFLDRGLASRDEAKKSGQYFSTDFVLDELKVMLTKAKADA